MSKCTCTRGGPAVTATTALPSPAFFDARSGELVPPYAPESDEHATTCDSAGGPLALLPVAAALTAVAVRRRRARPAASPS
ncbi:MYXO-CTERM sorting domain-containing protein, partial [Streptomyces rochei]